MKPMHEHIAVLGTAVLGAAVSFTAIEHGLRVLILIGSAIYVWRRALKKRLPKEED